MANYPDGPLKSKSLRMEAGDASLEKAGGSMDVEPFPGRALS